MMIYTIYTIYIMEDDGFGYNWGILKLWLFFFFNSFSLTLSKRLKNEITSELCHFLWYYHCKIFLIKLNYNKNINKKL